MYTDAQIPLTVANAQEASHAELFSVYSTYSIKTFRIHVAVKPYMKVLFLCMQYSVNFDLHYFQLILQWVNSEVVKVAMWFTESVGQQALRRGSVGSLDSGMSVSFQSTSASCDTSPAGGTASPQVGGPNASSLEDPQHQHLLQRRSITSNSSLFLGHLFRPRRASRTEINTTGVEVWGFGDIHLIPINIAWSLSCWLYMEEGRSMNFIPIHECC